jgi:hypothetical protein
MHEPSDEDRRRTGLISERVDESLAQLEALLQSFTSESAENAYAHLSRREKSQRGLELVAQYESAVLQYHLAENFGSDERTMSKMQGIERQRDASQEEKDSVAILRQLARAEAAAIELGLPDLTAEERASAKQASSNYQALLSMVAGRDR